LLCYDAPFAAGKGRFRFIDGGEDLCARAFAFLPQK
jgi:hypothetical protein